jgi:hypothetical protein
VSNRSISGSTLGKDPTCMMLDCVFSSQLNSRPDFNPDAYSICRRAPQCQPGISYEFCQPANDGLASVFQPGSVPSNRAITEVTNPFPKKKRTTNRYANECKKRILGNSRGGRNKGSQSRLLSAAFDLASGHAFAHFEMIKAMQKWHSK